MEMNKTVEESRFREKIQKINTFLHMICLSISFNSFFGAGANGVLVRF